MFLTQAKVEAEISAVTVERLLDHDGDGVIDTASLGQRMKSACGHVVTLIKGYKAEVPVVGEAPEEWERLALRYLISQLAIDYPGYFRMNGLAAQEAVNSEILTARAVEPTDQQVATASVAQDLW